MAAYNSPFTGEVVIEKADKSPELMSPLAQERLKYKPRCPKVLSTPDTVTATFFDNTTFKVSDRKVLSGYFPNTINYPLMSITSGENKVSELSVGVVFCGRQSPGGHNIVLGLFEYFKQLDKHNKVYGFIGGTSGLFSGKYTEITEELLVPYKNTGGYDLLGRSADNIQEDDFEKVATSCRNLSLNGLVLIGGAYTASDASLLAEYFLNSGVETRVTVVPCDYSRDLKNSFVETTVGFDTYCHCVGSLVGNTCTDSRSGGKYYHFIRILGRSPSHVVLETALQTQPTHAIISEEISSQRTTLLQVVNDVADIIVQRNESGLNYGVVLIPEGLVMGISELYYLLNEISIFVHRGMKKDEIIQQLTPWSRALYDFLPPIIRKQVFNPPESRGNVQLHSISTEVLIADLVSKELKSRSKSGLYKGKFEHQTHFFGYQARTSFPSLFDCDYAYSLGRTAAALVQNNLTGYMATVRNLKEEPKSWVPYAVPLLAMTTVEQQQGIYRPCIPESSVDMNDMPFESFVNNRETWAKKDSFINPGPIQFSGAGSWDTTTSLRLEKNDYLKRIGLIREQLKEIGELCLPGCDEMVLDCAIASLNGVRDQMAILKKHKL